MNRDIKTTECEWNEINIETVLSFLRHMNYSNSGRSARRLSENFQSLKKRKSLSTNLHDKFSSTSDKIQLNFHSFNKNNKRNLPVHNEMMTKCSCLLAVPPLNLYLHGLRNGIKCLTECREAFFSSTPGEVLSRFDSALVAFPTSTMLPLICHATMAMMILPTFQLHHQEELKDIVSKAFATTRNIYICSAWEDSKVTLEIF